MKPAATIPEKMEAETRIRKLFQQEGTLELVAGNRPFLLDDPDSIWFVGTNRLEIFAVEVVDGEPAGSRSPFSTIETGGMVCGMDLQSYGQGHGFLAVGLSGTELYRLTTERLREFSTDPEWSQVIGDLVDTWVRALSHGVTHSIRPRPQVDFQLSEDQMEIVLQPGARVNAKRPVAWVTVEEGGALFIGLEELGASDTPVPLTTETWLEAHQPCRLRSNATAKEIGRETLWQSLGPFYALICQCEFINKRLLAVDEYNRLKSKAEYRDAAREEALLFIASVMGHPGRTAPKAPSEAAEDALFTAVNLVGSSIGIEVRQHPDTNKEGKQIDPLQAIARASKFQLRSVALRGNWWTGDHGPMLAYIEKSKDPVALLQVDPCTYEMVNPRHGTRVRVTPQIASILSPFGFTFYRPFPERQLSAWDLVKFGARGLQREFRTVAIIGVALGLLGTLTPFFTGQIFDRVIPGADRFQLLQYSLALACAALCTAAFSITRSIAVLRVEGRMDHDVQAALWDRLLKLPSPFFRRFSAGDLADRAGGIDAIRQTISGVGVTAVLGSFTSLFYLGMLFVYDAKLAIVSTGLVFAAVAITTAANYAQLRYQRNQFTIRGYISGLVLQLLTGVAKLRVAGAEDHAFKVWAKAFSEQRRITYVIGRIGNFVSVFNAGYPVITSITLFFVLAGIQAEAAESGSLAAGMSTGKFIGFLTAFGLFLAAMLALSNASIQMLAVVPVFERLKPILLEPCEITEDRTHPGELMGEIELYHVNFSYDPEGPLILKDVSIHINPGEFVAFVGPSGSGKSTILRLLLGFETPGSGNVYYDAKDLETLDLRDLRQQLGVVLQSSKLMPTDIFHNIIGTNMLSIDDAWRAAREAGLEEDIKEMPMGMHTVVSEGGATFSGGQKQRLMIARAIVTRPRILFFDEATSALDNRTQKIVSESLDAMHATRIVIAHRLMYHCECGQDCGARGWESRARRQLRNVNGTGRTVCRIGQTAGRMIDEINDG